MNVAEFRDHGFKVLRSRKEHYCDECQRKIPKATNYWRKQETVEGMQMITKVHTNCLLFEDQPLKGEAA